MHSYNLRERKTEHKPDGGGTSSTAQTSRVQASINHTRESAPANNSDARDTLAQRFKQLDVDGDKGTTRRAVRMTSWDRDGGKGSGTQRNKLGVTMTTEDGEYKVTFMLKSAGLGGLHPKLDGRTAAHTEAIWEAFQRHPEVLAERYNQKARKRGLPEVTDPSELKTISIVSTNSPCETNLRDPEHGCGGIAAESMGMDDDTDARYLNKYQEGSKTELQALRDVTGQSRIDLSNPEKSQFSSDEEIDTDLLRGKDLEDESVLKEVLGNKTEDMEE